MFRHRWILCVLLLVIFPASRTGEAGGDLQDISVSSEHDSTDRWK